MFICDSDSALPHFKNPIKISQLLKTLQPIAGSHPIIFKIFSSYFYELTKQTPTFVLSMTYTQGMNIALSEKQKAVVEQVGISYEKIGMQPAAARVMGLLYVADKPELTFDEITDCLQISKSATSNAINLLLQTEQIEYTTFSGDRKRYFRLKISNWRESFAKKIEGMTSFNVLLRQVLEVRTPQTTEFNDSLEELINFLDYINRQLPKLLQDWENSKK